MLATLALLASAGSVSIYTGPRPEATETFHDWITGCDNTRDCAAVALQPVVPELAPAPDHLDILIEQSRAHHHDPVITIAAPNVPIPLAELAMFIDGVPAELPPAAGERITVTGPPARALVRKLRAGYKVALRHPDGRDEARTSLAGLTAALMRIDAQQGKTGTARALARPGTRQPYDDMPGYSVTLGRPASSDRSPPALNAEAIASLAAQDQCPIDADRPAPVPQVVRLDDNNSMVIAPWRCGSGAYNLYANVMILGESGQMRPATFDFDNGITGDGPGNLVVNVGWDASKREIESFALLRGTGDCGRRDRFIWDGTGFRLSEQQVMPHCRGSRHRIRVWRVDVRDR